MNLDDDQEYIKFRDAIRTEFRASTFLGRVVNFIIRLLKK